MGAQFMQEADKLTEDEDEDTFTEEEEEEQEAMVGTTTKPEDNPHSKENLKGKKGFYDGPKNNTDQCDKKKQLCCDPLAPKVLYDKCLEKRCWEIPIAPPECDQHGFCTGECNNGCCCFWM